MILSSLKIAQETLRGHRRRFLPGSIAGGCAAVCDCDHFYFDLGAFRQRRDLDGGPSRRLVVEIRAIDFVHDLEIVEIGKKDGRFQNVA